MSASMRPRDSQRVSPHDDEEEAPTSDPTPSVPGGTWTLPGVARRGGGRSGGSGGRIVVRGTSRYRVEPGDSQQSADEEDVEACGASGVVSESADAGEGDASALFSTRSDQGSPMSASRHEYIAEQLQQLSQIGGQSSRSSRPVAGTFPPNQPLSFTGTGGSYTLAGTAADSAASPGDSPGPRSASGAAAIVDATSQPPSTTAMLSPLSNSSSSGESAPLEISSPKMSSPNPAAAPGIPTAEIDPATRGLELDSPSGSNLSSGSGAPSVATPLPPGASSQNREQQQLAAVGHLEQLSDLSIVDSRRRGSAGARASGAGTSSSRGGSSSSDSLMYSMSVESSLSSPFSAFTAAAFGSGHSSRRGNGSDAFPPTKTPPSPHGVPLAPFEGGTLDLRRMSAGSADSAQRSGISQGRIFPGYGQATISSSSSSSSSSRGSRRDGGSVQYSRGDGSASLPGEERPAVSGGWAPPVHSPKEGREKDSAVAVAADEGQTREEMRTESSRDKSSRRLKLADAFGRAKVWGGMLEGEPRASPTLRTIEGENRTVLDQAVVLPCAPSDDEKVLYTKTGRAFLVSAGIFSLLALSTGLWLFTIAAPYFYWFGAPTTFLMFYLLFSYFGVAVWGKDFDPNEHAEAVRRARESRYFPSVDVFLPVCNEPTHLLDNTWKYVGALDYPFVTMHVLDDGGKEEVRQLAALHGFNYIRRENRMEMRKAGNLRYAFARTSGEFLAIFDADFCPRPEFLRETTPYFADGDLAILQTPQFFRRREEQTWVERGAGVTQELFYRMVQVNRNKFDAAICVGTCGVYRRSALAPFGGTAAIAYSEDVHTGFNCTKLGYKVKYIPQIMAMGTCPPGPRALFMQQYRWCMGSTTLLCNTEFWRSNLTVRQKMCYFSGMLYYAATAMSVFMGPLPSMLLIWFKPSAVLWFNISFSVPSILFSFVAMRIWAKQRFDMSCHRVKVIQSFSHLYAIRDRITNQAVPWIPTGGGAASRDSSGSYDSSVKLMICWTAMYTIVTIAGATWRATEFPLYHFLPSVALTLFNFALHISTLL